jgi:hypothetical protein
VNKALAQQFKIDSNKVRINKLRGKGNQNYYMQRAQDDIENNNWDA